MMFCTDFEALVFLLERGWIDQRGVLFSPTDRCEEWTTNEYKAMMFLVSEYDYAWGGKKC